ncbi:hypothetical protein [Nonomuraea rhodomycinica]|uniref:Uncharacterized protein n=1 Tax=Nonomuraea rhodomycinica TaxID=1712872 RepID=A0A7Y6IWV4_9ACTN|nr:hypothetical protein [Nonomuraea rhodomycinica]NUW45568.1 hypothetical protein [Nonomuraea rhodomycinica]
MPINPNACPGICNRAARAAWTSYDQALADHADAMTAWLRLPGDDRGPQPVAPEQPGMPVHEGEPVWCRRCPSIIRHALGELDDIGALLAASVDGHRGAAMAGPNGVKPLDHRQLVEELDDLFGFLVSVEDAWRPARGYPPRPRRARGADARMRTVGWLLGQLDNILLDPWSVEVGLDILRWHRRLLRMTKSDPTARRSPIECPRCRERQVQRRDDGYYECGSCCRLLNEREHDREYAEQADQHQQQEELTAR